MELVISTLEGSDAEFRALSSAGWTLFYALIPSCAHLGPRLITLVVGFHVCPSRGQAVVKNFLGRGQDPMKKLVKAMGPLPTEKCTNI